MGKTIKDRVRPLYKKIDYSRRILLEELKKKELQDE